MTDSQCMFCFLDHRIHNYLLFGALQALLFPVVNTRLVSSNLIIHIFTSLFVKFNHAYQGAWSCWPDTCSLFSGDGPDTELKRHHTHCSMKNILFILGLIFQSWWFGITFMFFLTDFGNDILLIL